MIAAVVLAVLVYSAAGIDYSGLAYFSPSMAGDVFRGLARPAWAYVYDGSGEDLLSLLLLTLGIAFLGTAIATVLALPITLLSSANLWRSCPWVSKAGKSVCNVLRAFPELVYAIIFVKMVGPGPFAGVLAIGVHQIGMLGGHGGKSGESHDRCGRRILADHVLCKDTAADAHIQLPFPEPF